MLQSNRSLLVVLTSLVACIDHGAAVQTVRLTPPIIKPMSQMDQIACYRPVRSVMPRIDVESAKCT